MTVLVSIDVDAIGVVEMALDEEVEPPPSPLQPQLGQGHPSGHEFIHGQNSTLLIY